MVGGEKGDGTSQKKKVKRLKKKSWGTPYGEYGRAKKSLNRGERRKKRSWARKKA